MYPMKQLEILMTVAFLFFTGCSAQKGDTGATGPQGETGAQGPAGSTVVRLCPNNANDSYPSVFNEYAFCMNGSLYGTYSSNGGFTAQILPGNWTSNAIGSSCNFTVGPNCQVTQQ
jgi:hypothetical protein